MLNSETICAIATAEGNAAIAVIRMSGTDTFAIVNKLFKAHNPAFSFEKADGFTIHFGTIMVQDEIVDEVLVSIFKNPHSYTGEDCVEISCHASSYIQQEILKLLLTNGARIAQPGEFTMRAYLNGKLDLSQAEAVADVIASQSEAAHRLAFSQLRGGYSSALKDLREQLLQFSALIELELDFSEEDVEFADRNALLQLCKKIHETISGLVDSFATGNAIKKGVPVAIVGEPNVGKSTLLNALLNEERAIVSEIPGTTRDTIEDHVTINGISFRFIDTAGIRLTNDSIETMGIRKTFEKIGEASVVLLLTDVQEPAAGVIARLHEIQNTVQPKTKIVILINKVDLVIESVATDFKTTVSQQTALDPDDCICISAKQQLHLALLKEKLVESVNVGVLSHRDSVVTNARHHEALLHALESVLIIEDGLATGLSGDLVALEIRQVLYYLGSITGTISTDETLGFIFRHFCIGK